MMTTFTIDHENHIRGFATAEEAAAASQTPLDTFGSQPEFAELAAQWPAERLVAIWNSLPGVAPVKRFQDHRTALRRIWQRIQGLGQAAPPAAQAAQPQADNKAKAGARAPQAATDKAQATRRAPAAKRVARRQKAAKTPPARGPRQGSKTAQVVALLRRQNGATLSEIVDQMGWQKHTVRGFIAGAMKKAGYTVDSFKPESGERTYRIQH